MQDSMGSGEEVSYSAQFLLNMLSYEANGDGAP